MSAYILKPDEIERRSFETITEILGDKKLNPEHELIIKRVIHTTADFEYADSLYFSSGVVWAIKEALQKGAHIVTDTNMARAGINKSVVNRFGGEVHCFISDADVTEAAKARGGTRAIAAMEKAAGHGAPLIFAIGNAPTALIRLCEMKAEELFEPVAVIGVPVGFVNILEAKQLLIESGIPCIVSQGRKGGSNVAAAIVNAIVYELAANIVE